MIGRRLAFDPEKGRFWVICDACGGWNLAPLDERWEVIDECEALFQKTPVRVSTENISLAVVFGRLDLIRIGRPPRKEMAIWRYADRLMGRRRTAYLQKGARAADSLAMVAGSGGFGGLLGVGLASVTAAPVMVPVGIAAGIIGGELWEGLGPLRIERILGRIVARVKIDRIDYSYVRTGHVPEMRIVGDEADWTLELPHSVGWRAYRGSHAIHVLGMMLPIANGFGASRKQVLAAVRELEQVEDARSYFGLAARRAHETGLADKGLGSYPRAVRLALEMAAHEETEREALEGRVKWLERRWREAERVAEIADSLFTDPVQGLPWIAPP